MPIIPVIVIVVIGTALAMLIAEAACRKFVSRENHTDDETLELKRNQCFVSKLAEEAFRSVVVDRENAADKRGYDAVTQLERWGMGAGLDARRPFLPTHPTAGEFRFGMIVG